MPETLGKYTSTRENPHANHDLRCTKYTDMDLMFFKKLFGTL